MNPPRLLTFNAGSSTIKIGLFSVQEGQAIRIGSGVIDFRHHPLQFKLVTDEQTIDIALTAEVTEDLREVLDETLGWFSKHFSIDALLAVGHRVVHGADMFVGPIVLNEQAITTLAALTPLAPLHQPQSLRLIKAIEHLRPHLLQTASFDTAFHQHQSERVRAFALPKKWFDSGVKRYGFHGLSYQFIYKKMTELFPAHAQGKTVVAHLGSGASACAFEAGISQDTSMGFSTLDGIPMATRCGALDPGVILYLLAHEKMQAKEVEHLLYGQSGLLGLSGVSADTRVLLESEDPGAKLALEVFTLRIAGEIARLATTLGGLETLVFTAGIGEHQAAIREAVCKQLKWLGVEIDSAVNEKQNLAPHTIPPVISLRHSRVLILVIPTDEEQIIAEEALSVLGQKNSLQTGDSCS